MQALFFNPGSRISEFMYQKEDCPNQKWCNWWRISLLTIPDWRWNITLACILRRSNPSRDELIISPQHSRLVRQGIPSLDTSTITSRSPGNLRMHLPMSCRSLSERSQQGNQNFLQANEALKHQVAHNLKDQYFGAIAMNYLFTSLKMQSFTQFQGQLALTFGKRGKKDSETHITTAAISFESSCGVHWEPIYGNSQKHQNKTDIQAAENNWHANCA